MRPLALVLIGTISLLATAPTVQAQDNPLLGNWQTTINWDRPGGLLISLLVGPAGQLGERVDNHDGQAYELAGQYTFDAATGDFEYTWKDYQPKQLCSTATGCQALPPPPVAFGTVNEVKVRFGSPSFFTGTATDGSQLSWVKVQ